MSVNNTAIGSALIIPDSLLNDLTKVDEKIKRIQDTSRATANVFNQSFASMTGNTSGLLAALQQVINQLGGIGSTAQNVASATQNMGSGLGTAAQGATNLRASITSVTDAINRMAGQIGQRSGGITSSISSLIESISVRIRRINTSLRQTQTQASATSSAAKEAAKAAKEQAQINLINQQTATATEKANVELAKQARLQAQAATEAAKLARAQAQLAQAQAMAATATERANAANERAARRATISQYSQSASSALGYANNSANVSSFNQRATAIKVLEQAMKNLNSTDADYKKNLADLSARYKQLKAEQDRLVGSYREMQTHHRSLMDTAGQLQRAFALVFSVSQIRGYIDTIAKVRGEFELQQRSLEAILQNKTEADTIFNKTVALAVQSPFQIKELVSYTKQLAAYRIESDKLYDTTKRLADVSAGLGVDMQRLILAYGQVKAAAYLRGTEVRQFTEAGINLYGELQALFKERDQADYTTAQIVDMISKRQVTFEDVEEVFRRITDQGGIFYRMQEIQAETLQGKIANFKDSVDVMMNEIGKDNEGLFKGAIDSATALMEHWESVANVGKALVAVLLLLKTQSMITGVAMSKVFTAEFSVNAAKSTAAFKLMGNGLKSAGIAALNLGKSLKAVFVTNLPLLAITAVAMAAYEAYDRISSYNKAVAKANEELVKARGAVADLANEYNNLQTATNNAQKVQERNNDPAKDIEARRTALQKLIDLANKEGLTLDIKVNEVKDEELDKVFNGAKEKYERFLTDMAIIEKKHAANEGNYSWGFISDAINEDADDYRNAVLEVLAQSNKLDVAIANVKANYSNLSEASKQYYNVIAAGRKDGESEIDYYTRMYKAMLQINRLNVGTNTGVPEWLKATNTTLKDISGDFSKIGTQAEEFEKELDNVLGEVIDNARKNGANEIQIKARIDRYAAQQGWDDIKKEFAYDHFDVRLQFNKDDVEKETSWVDNYLTTFFNNKTYKIKFNVTMPTEAKALDDFIKKGDNAAKAAKSWAEAEKRISAVGKNAKQIVADSNIADIMNSNPLYNIKSGDKVDVATLKEVIKEYKKINADIAESLGVNPFEKQNKKNAKQAAKEQRDILTEQINTLKDMRSQYEKLAASGSKAEAAQTVMNNFANQLKYVKMPDNIMANLANGIDKETVAKSIKEISKKFKEFSKQSSNMRTAVEMELDIDTERAKEKLDDIKNEVQNLFSQKDLHGKLSDLGLSDAQIQQMFGISTKSFEDIRKAIEDRYTTAYGANKADWGTDVTKQYESEMKDLNKRMYDEQVSNAQELLKAYKTQLSDQLQLDKWYYEERRKIQENEQIQKDPELAKQLEKNLTKQYNQKSDENTWKEFQNSDFYIRIFENLDATSTRVLEAMRDKLASIRDGLKNLTPEQLKQVVEQMEKVDSQLVNKNPFKGLVSGIKEYINYTKQRKQIETEYLAEVGKEDELKSQANAQNDIVLQKQEEYDNAVKLYGVNSEQAKQAEEALKIEKEKLDVILEELVAQGKITKEYAEQIRKADTLKNKIAEQAQEIAGYFSSFASGYGEVESMLQNFGVELPEEISGTLNGLSQASGGISKILNGDIIGGAFSTISGIGNTIDSIFGFGNHDKKLQKEIEKQQEIVETLQRAYDKLKESMDNAWSAASVIQANENTKKNIEAQISSYEKMIAAEEDKKDPDSSKIKEWKNQIDDLKDALKELEEQTKEAFGGFGSEANYKSAAQEFADAWIDAFNECEDTLEALKDTFDDYFNNMLKKQLMQRAAQKYLQPIFDAFDQAVSGGSAGNNDGREVTAEEIAKIQKLKDAQLEAFDDYANALMEVLGVKPSGSSSSLSQLQQGIESLSESTGQALESLLNSIRFFVAQQATDVSAIRQLLQQPSSIDLSTSTDAPMLTELKAQTSYLKSIDSRLEKVIKISGHPKQGPGIKVFLD